MDSRRLGFPFSGFRPIPQNPIFIHASLPATLSANMQIFICFATGSSQQIVHVVYVSITAVTAVIHTLAAIQSQFSWNIFFFYWFHFVAEYFQPKEREKEREREKPTLNLLNFCFCNSNTWMLSETLNTTMKYNDNDTNKRILVFFFFLSCPHFLRGKNCILVSFFLPVYCWAIFQFATVRKWHLKWHRSNRFITLSVGNDHGFESKIEKKNFVEKIPFDHLRLFEFRYLTIIRFNQLDFVRFNRACPQYAILGPR